MSEPRPRDHDVERELLSLQEQEDRGDGTPKEHRRAEQLQRRLDVDEAGAERRADYAENQEQAADEDAERDRHRRHPGSGG